MANNLTTNPIYIDTFSSDVTVSSGSCKVTSIIFNSAAAGDKLVFIDNKANIVFEMRNNVAGGGKEWVPAKPQLFNNGLILDVSASTGVGAGDIVIICLE